MIIFFKIISSRGPAFVSFCSAKPVDYDGYDGSYDDFGVRVVSTDQTYRSESPSDAFWANN